ncbi:MAG: hypothetical protein ACLS8R_02990 [Anaeromassilibacillus sp.]
MYRYDEVMTYCQEEDVKFIRLAFCDLAGNQKNIAIMPTELGRAFEYGISLTLPRSRLWRRNQIRPIPFPRPFYAFVLPWRPARPGCADVL